MARYFVATTLLAPEPLIIRSFVQAYRGIAPLKIGKTDRNTHAGSFPLVIKAIIFDACPQILEGPSRLPGIAVNPHNGKLLATDSAKEIRAADVLFDPAGDRFNTVSPAGCP